MNTQPRSRFPIVLTVLASLVAVAIIAGFSIFGYVNNIRNTGIEKENRMVGQYQDNQNILSNYILSFNESLGIADRQSEELNRILVEAVKGRYDGEMEPGSGGEMFSAISEAYPDLTATSESYQKVQDLVISGRKSYENAQTQLYDYIMDYRTWSEQGLVRSNVVDFLGFPSDQMKIRIGDETLTGEDALDRMEQLVLVEEAVESYETGTQDPLIMPRDDE